MTDKLAKSFKFSSLSTFEKVFSISSISLILILCLLKYGLPSANNFAFAIYLFSIVLFSIFIPYFSSKIKKYKGQLENLKSNMDARIYGNLQEYNSYLTQEKLLRLTLMLKLEIDKNPIQDNETEMVLVDTIHDLHGEYVQAIAEATKKAYLICYGKIPSNGVFDEIDSLANAGNYTALRTKISTYFQSSNINELSSQVAGLKIKLLNLEDSKDNTIYIAAFMNVFALVVMHYENSLHNNEVISTLELLMSQ